MSKEKIFIAKASRFETDNNKIARRFIRVEKHEDGFKVQDADNTMAFFESKCPAGTIGTVYEVEVQGEQFLLKIATAVGRLSDPERIRVWDLRDQSFMDYRAAKKVEKELSSIREINEIAKQLHKVYYELPYNQRIGFEIRLVEAVRNGKF